MNRLLHRLHNQHVSSAPLPTPEAVVALLAAVQSQDYLGAKWSVGQRAKNATDAGIDEAFNQGRILRTHVLRPTWHFVLPADIRWMVELTAPHVLGLMKYRHRQLELDDAVYTRARALLVKALRDGTHLTRAELSELFAGGKIVAKGERLAHLVMRMELEALICSGALRGKQHTYALLEERAPNALRLTRDEGLAELALRFFRGHAPATLRHFVWWSGLKVADARRGLAAVEHQLHRETIDETTHWFSDEPPAARIRRTGAYLIPEYDEALTGYRDLGVSDLPSKRQKLGEVFVRPVIIDGTRVGTWRRIFAGRTVTLETARLAPLDEDQLAQLEKTAEKYGRFLELPVTVA